MTGETGATRHVVRAAIARTLLTKFFGYGASPIVSAIAAPSFAFIVITAFEIPTSSRVPSPGNEV